MGNEIGVVRALWGSLFTGAETGKDPPFREAALFLIKRHKDQDPGFSSTCLLHHVKNPDRTFGQDH
jgi:hypothetical protein